MEKRIYFTYTCPVSRKTYDGHPRNGHLYTHDNDLEEAILTIHAIARTYNQPVSWVINDQEYTDQEGLLHYFRKWQDEGDSIIVTMELTTDPPGVDKYDTEQVIRWVDARCREAGLRVDGLWSLRFLESDLAAISRLPKEEFPWTRNLAGSCWHQYEIDNSTWGGCPYMPYYPSLKNIRASAGDGEPGEFLMFEWLSRDPNAILHGGGAAVFSLDPADTNRADAGGFDNEPDALSYSNRLISELAKQIQLNDTVVINVNEEARHFQTEGHDKSYMLDGMFRHAGETFPEIQRIGYKKLWHIFRDRHPVSPERFIVWNNQDGRKDLGCAALYEDQGVQMCFIQESGSFPVEYFDYRLNLPGNDGNSAYPMSTLPELELLSSEIRKDEIEAVVFASAPVDCGVMLWNAGAVEGTRVIPLTGQISHARSGLYGHMFLRVNLEPGKNVIKLRLEQLD